MKSTFIFFQKIVFVTLINSQKIAARKTIKVVRTVIKTIKTRKSNSCDAAHYNNDNANNSNAEDDNNNDKNNHIIYNNNDANNAVDDLDERISLS